MMGVSLRFKRIPSITGIAAIGALLGAMQLTASVPALAATNGANSIPVPVISGLSPQSIAAGSGPLTLTISGRNFLPRGARSGSQVSWNGRALATTSVSRTKITVILSSVSLRTPGAKTVRVFNTGTLKSNIVFLRITKPAVGNAAPVIATLNPGNVTAGGPAFKLAVNGSNFLASSVFRWSGRTLPITYVSARQLLAAVPASYIGSAAVVMVTVANPSPTGGGSNAVTFAISSANPVPSISALSQTSAVAGAAGFVLTLVGSNFVPSSTVHWNGTALGTNYVSAGQLNASVSAASIVHPGVANVTVSNPAPGGGTSGNAVFTIRTGPISGPKMVQFNTYQTINANGENNSTLKFNSMTKAGDAIWVAVTLSDYAGAHTIAISDTQGNVYTKLAQENDGAPGSQSVAHFYAANIVGDTFTPDTITMVWGYEDYKGVFIAEIGGVSSTPLVGHSANIQDGLSSGTDNVTSGGIAVGVAQTPALLVALSMNTSGGSSNLGGSGYGGPAAGSGFTQDAQLWNWGVNLATVETSTIVSAGSSAPLYNAPDTDSYVTVAAVFH